MKLYTQIFSLLLLTIAISCSDNKLKEKELELREREVTLKEKELNIRQSNKPRNNINKKNNIVDVLFGNVKRVTESSSDKQKTILLYDVNGYLQEQNNYNDDYFINDKSPKNKVFHQYIYKYDENKNLLEVRDKRYENNILVFSQTYHFYGKEKKTIIKDYDTKHYPEQPTKTTFINDDKGNKIEAYDFFNGRNDWTRKNTYRYDDKANLIETSTFNQYYNSTDKTLYKYDEKNNEVEYKNYFNGELRFKRTYKYDEYGNRVEEDFYYNSETDFEKTIYKYEDFDLENNWTLKITINNRGGTEKLKRTIEYY